MRASLGSVLVGLALVATTACSDDAGNPRDALQAGIPVECVASDVVLDRGTDGAMQAFLFVVEVRNVSQRTCRVSADVTLRIEGPQASRIAGNPARATLKGEIAADGTAAVWSFFHEPCGSGVLTFTADFGDYGRLRWPFELPACGRVPDNAPSVTLEPPPG